VELGWHLPGIDDAPENPRWEQLRQSLTAHVLLRFAQRVKDAQGDDRSEEISAVQTAALRQMGGELWRGDERCVVVDDRFGAPPPPRLFREREDPEGEDVGYVGRRVRSVIRRMGLPLIADAESVVEFVREAVENTTDHAIRDLEKRRVSGLRFFQARRIGLAQHHPEGLAATTTGSVVAEYLERWRSLAPPEERRSSYLVEMTIADCGLGIAAQLYRDENIYTNSSAAELEVLLRATRRDESSKSASVAGRGQGLSKMREAAAELHGIVVVRSGRFELAADTSEATPPGQDGWHVAEQPFLRGTSVSLLLPWWEAAQGQLPDAPQQKLIE